MSEASGRRSSMSNREELSSQIGGGGQRPNNSNIVHSISTHSLAVQDVSHDEGSVELLERLKINDEKDLELLPEGGLLACIAAPPEAADGRRVPLTDVVRVGVEREFDLPGLLMGLTIIALCLGLIFGAGYIQETLTEEVCARVGFCKKWSPSSASEKGKKAGENQPQEINFTATEAATASGRNETAAKEASESVVHYAPFILVGLLWLRFFGEELIHGLKSLANLFLPACAAFYTCTVDFAGSATDPYRMPLGACGKYDDMCAKVCDQLVRRRNAVRGISSIVSYGRLTGVVPGFFNDYDVMLTTETLSIIRTPLFCQAHFKENVTIMVEDIGDISVSKSPKLRTFGHVLLALAVLIPLLIALFAGSTDTSVGIAISLVLCFLVILMNRFGPSDYSVKISSKSNRTLNRMAGFGADRRPSFCCENQSTANEIAVVIRKAQLERKRMQEIAALHPAADGDDALLMASRRESAQNLMAYDTDDARTSASGGAAGGRGEGDREHLIAAEQAVENVRAALKASHSQQQQQQVASSSSSSATVTASSYSSPSSSSRKNNGSSSDVNAKVSDASVTADYDAYRSPQQK